MQVFITNPSGMKVDASWGDVVVRTDQPAEGGDPTLPTPFDLFLAAVSACGGFFAFRFCQARSISTKGMRLVADFEKSGDMISRISLKIELPPGFPDKYREAVVRAAGACKVLKHLETPPSVIVEIAES